MNDLTSGVDLGVFRQNLTGPASFNGYVLSLFAVAAIWVTVVVDIGANEAPSLRTLAIGFGSMAVALVWLAGFGRIVLSIPGNGIWKLLAVLATYSTSGLVRNLIGAWLAYGTDVPNPISRVVAAGTGSLALLAFAGITANRRYNSRALQQSLFAERRKLMWLSATYDEKIAQAQRDLLGQLSSQLYPRIRAVLASLQSYDKGLRGKTSEELVDTVANVVRPMCERLSSTADTSAEYFDELVGATQAVDAPSRDVKVVSAIKPTQTVGLLLLVSFTLAPVLGQEARPLVFVVASFISWVAISILRRTWPKRFQTLRLDVATSILTAFYSIVFAVDMVLVAGFEASLTTQLVRVTFSVGGAAVLARMALIEQARLELEDQLREENLLLAEIVSALRKRIWLLRRNTAWLLHGPVQSSLMAAALALSDGAAPKVSIPDLAENIEQAVDSLRSGRSSRQSFQAALEEIAKVWSRSAEVTWHAAIEAQQLMDSDEDTRDCIVEIVREGVSNAVRHGSAKRVQIEVALHGPSKVGIQICDDGSGDNGSGKPGLGSAMLDQISLSWSRTNIDQGFCLAAEVVSSN